MPGAGHWDEALFNLRAKQAPHSCLSLTWPIRCCVCGNACGRLAELIDYSTGARWQPRQCGVAVLLVAHTNAARSSSMYCLTHDMVCAELRTDQGRLGAHLDGGIVALQPNDLSNQLVLAHAHQLIHGGTTHVVGHHHRARHLADIAAAAAVVAASLSARRMARAMQLVWRSRSCSAHKVS